MGERRKARKANKEKTKRLSAKSNLAGLKKGPVAKIGDKRKARKAAKAKEKALKERSNLAGLKKGPVAKKAYVKKMDDGAAAQQLKNLGKPSSVNEKKGHAKSYEKQGPVAKTGSYKSAEMHYMENELHNKKTGHDVAARYDKKKLGSILSKHMSRNK